MPKANITRRCTDQSIAAVSLTFSLASIHVAEQAKNKCDLSLSLFSSILHEMKDCIAFRLLAAECEHDSLVLEGRQTAIAAVQPTEHLKR